MTRLLRIILLLAMVAPIASCGVKGRLKTPDQIQRIEAKKAAEAQKKAEEAAEEKDNSGATPAEQK